MPTESPLRATMDVVAGGVRQTRVRMRWSQRELSRRSGVPQSLISDLERGHLTTIRLVDVDALFSALGIRYRLTIEPPFIAGPLQTDFVHATCAAHVERRLRAAGWDVRREVEIGSDRSRGWIDALAWHPGRSFLLVIEIKTELHDLGAIERTLNWYQREAWTAARSRGLRPLRVESALLLLQTEANDRSVSLIRDALAQAFPVRAAALLASVDATAAEPGGRALAMIDPRSHRSRWLRPTRIDGRRSAAPYVDYIDAVRQMERPLRRRASIDHRRDQSPTGKHG